MTGNVFNIQRYSLFDGTGVRTVVFLKGCPLRCKWCHNPEGLTAEPVVMFNFSRCIGCGDCTKVCEYGRHKIIDGVHVITDIDCIRCGKCADICAALALSLWGKEMSTDEIMEIVKRDMPFYKESGGGLTLSGGEPLMQPDFVLDILKKAKENGISTCIETSGYGNAEKLAEIAKYTDKFLFDYKATSDSEHIRLCGVSQKPILDNLALLDSLDAQIVLRCPIIPGINDTKEHFAGIAATAKKYNGILEVQLEPYHKLGESKAVQLGLTDYFKGTVPQKSDMEEYCRFISEICMKPVSVI